MSAKMRITVRGLIDTAVEKILVLGKDDANEEVETLRGVVEDLIIFWGLPQSLLHEFNRAITRIE